MRTFTAGLLLGSVCLSMFVFFCLSACDDDVWIYMFSVVEFTIDFITYIFIVIVCVCVVCLCPVLGVVVWVLTQFLRLTGL